MPVDRSQPVYPPSKGEDILAQWGDDVSEHVVQRFANDADRDAKWANPPTGALCVTVDTLTLWKYDGTNWVTTDPVRTWTSEYTGGSTAFAHTTQVTATVTVPVKARHRYLFRAQAEVLESAHRGGFSIGLILVRDGGLGKDNLIIATRVSEAGANGGSIFLSGYWVAPSTKNERFWLDAYANNGQVWITGGNSPYRPVLIIEDGGPT